MDTKSDSTQANISVSMVGFEDGETFKEILNHGKKITEILSEHGYEVKSFTNINDNSFRLLCKVN